MYKTSSKFRATTTFNNAVYSKNHEEKPEIPPVKIIAHKWYKPPLDEKEFRVGRVRPGKVIKVFKFGAVVDLHGTEGFIHISEMADHWIERPSEVVQKGNILRFKIINIEKSKNNYKISLTLKGIEQAKKR